MARDGGGFYEDFIDDDHQNPGPTKGKPKRISSEPGYESPMQQHDDRDDYPDDGPGMDFDAVLPIYTNLDDDVDMFNDDRRPDDQYLPVPEAIPSRPTIPTNTNRFAQPDPRDEEVYSEEGKVEGKNRKPMVIILSILAGLVIIAGISTNALRGTPVTPADPVASETSSAPTTEQANIDVPGETVSTSGKGSLNSGVELIAAHNYAYYVNRDGGLVLDTFNPKTGYVTGEIQTGIDETPEGTTHSLDITYTGTGGVYNVILSLRTPDGQVYRYLQDYTLSKSGGRYFIDSKENLGSAD